MILLSASKVWLWIQRDGGIWSFLTWTRSHLSLHRHPEVSLEVVEVETLLILQENLFDFLLELGDPVSRWMFSVPDLLQQILFVHLRLENEFSIFFGKYYFLCIESFWEDFWCVHRFQLLNVCNHYVTFPNFPGQRAYPRNNPGKTFFPNWWILDWSFAVIRWYSTNEPNWMIGPLNGSPKRLSYGVFPSDMRSWMFRR